VTRHVSFEEYGIRNAASARWAIATALGERVQLEAEVVEIVHTKRSVVVRHRQDGVDHEVEGRCVVKATPATEPWP